MTRVAYGECSYQGMVSLFSQPEYQEAVHLEVGDFIAYMGLYTIMLKK